VRIKVISQYVNVYMCKSPAILDILAPQEGTTGEGVKLKEEKEIFFVLCLDYISFVSCFAKYGPCICAFGVPMMS
jgi:hypothetical protein